MEYVEIRELGNIVTGKTPPTENTVFYGGKYPFITPTDIESFDKKYLHFTERTLSEEGGRKIKNCQLPEGSICFVCIGSTIGKMCMTNCISFTNQQINSIIPNEKCDGNYLFYLLRHVKGYFQSIGGGTGSGKGIVNKSVFQKSKILIAKDQKIQKRIANILSAYDNLIENNNRRIRILEQMAENLYKEWFVRFRFPGHETAEFENGLPKRWTIQRLGKFGISLDSGSRPKGGIDESLIEGIPSLGAEAVRELAEFDYSSVKYIPYEYFGKMKRGKFDGNAILVYKDGAYIGKTTIFRNEFPFKTFAVNEHVFLMNANNHSYQNYLYFTLHQREYFFLMQNLNRNAAQPGLAKTDMERIKILIPPEELVNKFNKHIDRVFDEIFQLAKANENLIKQRDMLLPRLMSGKLEV